MFLAARAAGGPAAGAIAFLGAALCPALTAHGALVAADGVFALFFFAAFAALWAWDRTRRTAWAAAAGAALGAALCAKAAAAVFLPLPALWILWRTGFRKSPRPALLYAAGMAAAVLLVYRGTQVPFLFDILRFTGELLSNGRRSFVLGRILEQGAWYYFPVAFLLKTPAAVLIGLLLVLLGWRRGESKVPFLLWAPGAAFFVLACASRVQIGHRHILALYPFLYVAVGLGLAPYLTRRGGRVLVGALGLWTVAAALRAAPFPLAYFNEIAGGPSRGHRFLTDSNVDWGQGLKALKGYLAREGVEDFYFSYFGSVDPRIYGLRFLDVASINPAPGETAGADPRRGKKALLVVSATNLMGTYYKDPAAFAWLRPFRPEAVLAGSLLVYDVTDSPAVHRWLSEHFRRTGRTAAADREARWAADLEKQPPS